VLAVDVMSGFAEAMRLAGEEVGRLLAAFGKALGPFFALAACIEGHERPRDRHRCRKCNPHGNPGPLAVNGHEYDRRRKARQRRKASS
jgi:hypothetical protein